MPLKQQNKFSYIQRAAVTLFPFLFETVSTDWWCLQALIVGFVEQAAGAAVCQVALIGAAAAAAERARYIPAGQKKKGRNIFNNKKMCWEYP